MKDIIHTERLYLTPLEIKDANRYVQIAKNMRIAKKENPDYFLYTRFDYSSVRNDSDLPNAIRGLIISPKKPVPSETIKRFNICLKNGYIIGYIGFLHNSAEKISSDLGIFLDPTYEHKGYAFEAQKSLLAYYFVNYDDKIYLTIYPKNLPSYHLNTKCGATKIGHVEISKIWFGKRYISYYTPKFYQNSFSKKIYNSRKGKTIFV